MDKKKLPYLVVIVPAVVLTSNSVRRDDQARDASMDICKAKVREWNDQRAVHFGTYHAEYLGDKNYRLTWKNAAMENSQGEMIDALIVCRVREHAGEGLRATIGMK